MLIADVFDVVLQDSDGDVIATTSLQEANIDVSVQENDVRAGKGNQLIGILHSDRDIAINLTDAEFKYEWLAKQLGQDIKTGAGIGYAMPKFYTATENTDTMEIELDEEPLSTDSGLKIYDADGEEIVEATGYTISGSTVELLEAAEGDRIEVRTYKYNTDEGTETIEIDNSVFAKGVVCILETLEIDGEENPKNKIQYQFTNALPSGNFTVNTQSERNASTQAFDLRVVTPSTSTKVGKILRIPIST
ncbi:MAG: hypothetical protein ACOCQD_05045 [archaeon]